MIRKKTTAAVAIALATALSLAACSSSGGKQETTSGGSNAGVADTPKMTVAMITHQAPGDTFWDIIRKGAEAAAAKDNINLDYSNDPDATKQAQLIQAAIDKKVDGIAVTDPNTGALGSAIKAAVAAGIPVTMFNAGGNDALGLGAIGYFGQGEFEAGVGAGKKIVSEGGKNILCVIQEQGQQQLEDRCDGVIKGAEGAKVSRLYVNGRDDSAVTTSIQAKLTEDPSIDWVLALGAPFALDAVKSVQQAGSKAKIGTFDTNKELVGAIKDGKVAFAIDQQPYLQGYLAVDALWLYNTNGNTIGGGENVATGPAFIDASNVEKVAKFAANGTR
ncbi:sugar ABC transporter substrate-binding protein [Nostocoides sp. Soil756]|jgi:simple sugar transport system substrate-binding protein|uniref:sugar ABC transporter substrate-binding protein n=1 Tax=Nostocoides sp. Soil756 TaxID=1736399 RepID=UPI0006FCB1A9|nr:sugar ABC transporter substrate-binding protein [Tetrasphaera sp. Soil756]KRE63626.1 sugar ABC transporter substrate-binding protein [Tetrasphaera sp. Soil756]